MTITPAPIDPPEIHEVLWSGFNGAVGWDIGANVGQSLGEMNLRFDLVHTFEPAEECLPLLRDNARMLTGIAVHPIALSNITEVIELVDIPDKINTGQLVSYEAEGMEYDARQQGGKLRKVHAYRADDFLKLLSPRDVPDFMKIDVEGHELKVLDGASGIIREWQPDMLIEIHSKVLGESIVKFLEGFGYDIEVVRHPHYTARTGLEHMREVHYWLRCFN
jgi:FkbM family methyltransferase